MAKWEEVLDHQLDLAQWFGSPEGAAFSEAFGRSITDRLSAVVSAANSGDQEAMDQLLASASSEDERRKYMESVSNGIALAGAQNLAQAFASNLGARLGTEIFNADPVYVEPDIMTVIKAAIPTFQPEPLQETDLVAIEVPAENIEEAAKIIRYEFEDNLSIDPTGIPFPCDIEVGPNWGALEKMK